MKTTLNDIAALLTEQNNLLRQLLNAPPVTNAAPSPVHEHQIRKAAQADWAEIMAKKARKQSNAA